MLNLKNNRKTLILTLTFYFPIFLILHTVPFLLGHGLFNIPKPLGRWLPIERWIVWVLPALILIKTFEKELYISFKNMFTNKIKLKTFLCCFFPALLFLLIQLIGFKYLKCDQLREFSNIKDFFTLFLEKSWRALVTPAITEEVVFRAWILNAFLGQAATKKKKIIAIILSNILFVVTHLPVYIFVYKYTLINALASFVSIFVVGSIFSIMFLKSKNIILPIFIHCFWDTFMFTFFV